MQMHAGNGRRWQRYTQISVMVTSNRATVTVSVLCDLDL